MAEAKEAMRSGPLRRQEEKEGKPGIGATKPSCRGIAQVAGPAALNAPNTDAMQTNKTSRLGRRNPKLHSVADVLKLSVMQLQFSFLKKIRSSWNYQ